MDEERVTPLRLVLGPASGVVGLGAAAAAVAHGLDRFAFGAGTADLAHWTGLSLALAAGFFLTAGVMRLTRWRLVRDGHSHLVGTALVVMGAVCLPLGVSTAVLLPADSPLVGSLVRCTAAAVVMLLLVRALHTIELGPRHRLGRLLPPLLALVAMTCVGLLGLVTARPELVDATTVSLALPSAVLSAGWLALAALAALRSDRLPWARRAGPLFLGMSIAEAMRALDARPLSNETLGGVMLCTVMAALAARSALADLDTAVRDDEDDHASMSLALASTHEEAESLTHWREQLTHDAGNVLAGLRAAVEVMGQQEAMADPDAVARLQGVAEEEVEQLAYMLAHTSPDADCGRFDAAVVVRRAAACATILGTDVRVRGTHAVASGQPGALAAALQSLLVNAATHAPGSRVELHVTSSDDTVRVVCSDDGPGLVPGDVPRIFERGSRGVDSRGSGLGLYAARRVVREQGGDLELAKTTRGATFVLTLPAALAEELLVRPPAQRPSSPAGHPAGHRSRP